MNKTKPFFYALAAAFAVCLPSGRALAAVGTYESLAMGQGTLYLQGSQGSWDGTAQLLQGSLSMSYDGGTTWVNQSATGEGTTSAAWAVIRGSGSALSDETIPWQGYAKIYWPSGLSDGHGYVYQYVTVTYDIDDVGYSSTMAWTQGAGNSATAYADADDGETAYSAESGYNAADHNDQEDELPFYTDHHYVSSTWSVSQLTPVTGQPGYYITPNTTFFSSYMKSQVSYTQAVGQSVQSNGAGTQVDVFFDTSGAHGLGANAITFS